MEAENEVDLDLEIDLLTDTEPDKEALVLREADMEVEGDQDLE